MKVGFLGMGVMGLPMAKNLVKKSGHEIVGFDVAEQAPGGIRCRRRHRCEGRRRDLQDL